MVKLGVPTAEVYARYKSEGRCANCGKIGNGSPNCTDCRAARNERFRKKAECVECTCAIPPRPGKRPRSRFDFCRAQINRNRYRNLAPERKKKRRLQLGEYARKWRNTNRMRQMDNDLRRKYGITLEEFQARFEKQDGNCAICRTALANLFAPGAERKLLAVDHCHTTGAVRGILCSKCNMALGLLGDDPDRLAVARDYLLRC